MWVKPRKVDNVKSLSSIAAIADHLLFGKAALKTLGAVKRKSNDSVDLVAVHSRQLPAKRFGRHNAQMPLNFLPDGRGKAK
jgi:hypothetical protein